MATPNSFLGSRLLVCLLPETGRECCVPRKDGDPLFRDMGKLTGNDREIAKDFMQMLARRAAEKKGSGG